MNTHTRERQSVESLEIGREIEISAPIDIAFEALLVELGPEGQMPGGKPFPMKIEPWPGGQQVPAASAAIPAISGAMCRSSSRRRSWRFAGRS